MKKSLLFAIIGAIVWLGAAFLGGLYTMQDHSNFLADPSPVPLFIYSFISGIGFLVTIASFIIYVVSLLKK
ncbi:hypothetical protein PALU110988_30370 [Paenibacillus lupini]|uniref:hypothetical protein n=1 Tax=Paenibacillus lupini TaxID=1450204 RepID=UPI00141F12F9|nr:hypothetical protein [Paenibacillus lupini]NIK21602.1 hypothetical protein [Paenibacillus lupini]